MTKAEIKKLNTMRRNGSSASEISAKLGISVNTVRSYIRRHPDVEGCRPCRNCGKPLIQPPGRKEKLFCSDKCRMEWWNSHRDCGSKKAYYKLRCSYCGKEFESYGNKNRKYCCRQCYLDSLRAH